MRLVTTYDRGYVELPPARWLGYCLFAERASAPLLARWLLLLLPQELAVLLARLKAGGHKCLIFTQMSKMLDVLEVWAGAAAAMVEGGGGVRVEMPHITAAAGADFTP